MKCEYYHKDTEKYYSYGVDGTKITGERTIGLCFGTNTHDQCFCEGDTNYCDISKIAPFKTRYDMLTTLPKEEVDRILTELCLTCYTKGIGRAGETVSFEEKLDAYREMSEFLNAWLKEVEVRE